MLIYNSENEYKYSNLSHHNNTYSKTFERATSPKKQLSTKNISFLRSLGFKVTTI